jgi:hypothetical protein
MVKKDNNTEIETWKQRSEAGNIPSIFEDELAGGLMHPFQNPLKALKHKE